MALDGSSHFATSRKAEFAVELAGIVEANNVLRLIQEEILGPEKKPEEGIRFDDSLEVGDATGFRLHELDPRAFAFLAFLLELLR